MSELVDDKSAQEAGDSQESDSSEPEAQGARPDVSRLRLPAEGELDGILGAYSVSELQMFCRTGLIPETAQANQSDSPLQPAVLHPFISGPHFRGPYPILFKRTSTGIRSESLATSIDSAADALEGDSDTTEIQKRGLLVLENLLGEATSGGPIQDLIPLIDQVEPKLSESVNGKKGRIEAFKAALSTFRAGVNAGSMLVPFSVSGVLGLMTEYVMADSEKRSHGFREEIDWLASSLGDLLRVEEDDSTDGRSVERLQHTVGGAYSREFDFGSLSHLLEEAPHGPAMESSRRERIQATLENLINISESLYGERQKTVFEGVDDTTSELEDRIGHFTELVKAVQISRLEVENRYRPDRHDDLFASFSSESIDSNLRLAFPPVISFLSSTDETSGISSLLPLLQSHWSVRVLLSFDRVLDDRGQFTPEASVAGTAVSLSSVFVQQSCLSMADFISEGFALSCSFGGSSLISVFTGSEDTHGELDPFLRSAIASDSRGLPAFRYHPDPAMDWADQFSATENEQAESIWPETDLLIVNEDGSESSMSISISAADFMSCDSRFSAHFLPFAPSVSSDHLIPLTEYFDLDSADRQDAIPFVWMSDVDGRLIRSAVSPRVMRTTRMAQSRWVMIQEWSGLRSSIADRRLQVARDEMLAEQKEAIQAVTEEFENRMGATTDSLARQIVENIAAGLLGVQGTTVPTGIKILPASTPSPDESAAAVEEAVEAVEAPVDEDDDDLALPLDDPYIDTPLCTTCNECTNLNGLLFAYNGEKQAYIQDASAGTFRDLVLAAEKCPVRIIHPGKPLNESEEGLDEWIERAKPFI